MHHLTSSTPHHILLCNIFQYICIIFQYLCNIFQYFCDIFQYIQISMQYLCIASSTPPHICLRNIFHFQNRYWFVLVSTCIRICFDSYPVSSLHTTTNKSAWHEWRTLAFCVLVLSPVLIEKKYDEKGNTTATPKSITFARKALALHQVQDLVSDGGYAEVLNIARISPKWQIGHLYNRW